MGRRNEEEVILLFDGEMAADTERDSLVAIAVGLSEELPVRHDLDVAPVAAYVIETLGHLLHDEQRARPNLAITLHHEAVFGDDGADRKGAGVLECRVRLRRLFLPRQRRPDGSQNPWTTGFA